MDKLTLLISAILDSKFKDQIVSDINRIQEQINKNPLNFKVNIDNKEFKQLSDNLQKISVDMNKALNINAEVSTLDKYSEKFTQIAGQSQKQTEYVKEFTNALGQSVKEVNKLDEEGKSVVATFTTITDNIKKQREEEQKLIDAMAKGREKAEIKSKQNDRKEELAQSKAINKALEEQYILNQKNEQLELSYWSKRRKEAVENITMKNTELQKMKEYYSQLEKTSLKESEISSKVSNALAKQKSNIEQRNYNYGQTLTGVDSSVFDTRESFLSNIKKQYGDTAEIIGKFNAEQLKTGEIIKRVTYHAQDGQGNWRKYTDTLNMTTGEMYRLDAGMTKVINRELTLGKAISTAFQKFPIWLGVTTAYMGMIHSISEGMQTLQELDSLMVDIAKVTDLSADAMERLKKGSFDAANIFGRTAQDYLKSVAEFSRAGYENQAEGLSKISLLSQNVGELTAEQSNEFLLATDAAYKYKGSQEELMKVLDGVNEIDNKFATSIQKVSSGISVAGAVASNAGVGVNELSSAVGTMTAISQESGDVAGRAFKSIIMNLRQIKGDIGDGEIIDDEKLSKSAKSLEDVGIKVHELRNGIEELRNPMNILKELSDKWNTLSSMKQAPIIEALAGKYRANQLVALLENFDMYEKMLTSYANASGSAMEENEKRMDSWEAKVNKLSNTVSEFWNNTINTNLVKGFIDTLSGLVSFLDGTLNNSFTKFILQIGLTSTALYGAGLAATALKNSYLATVVGVFAIDVAEKGLMATTQALTATMLASPLFWVVAGTATIFAITKAVDSLTVSVEEQRKKVESLTQEYNKLKTEIDKYKDIKNKTPEQTQYLSLLERELQLQQDLLKTEKERLMRKELLGEGVWGKGVSGDIQQTIQDFENLKTAMKANQEDIANMQKEWTTEQLKKYSNDDIALANIEDLKKAAKEIESTLINQKLKIDDWRKTLGYVPKEIQQLAIQIDSLLPELKSINPVLESNAETSKKTSVDINNSNQIQSKSFEDLAKDVKTTVNDIKDLNDIQADLSKGNKLTADSVIDLITKYPELINYIKETADGYTIEAGAIDIVKQGLIDKKIIALESELGITEAVKASLEARLESYGIELEAIKTLNDARSASEALFSKVPDFVKQNTGYQQYEASVNKQLEGIAKLNTLKGLLQSGLKTGVKVSKPPSGGTAEKQEDQVLIEKDRYYDLNQELAKNNALLGENKAKQELTTLEEKNKLLQQEIDLHKQRQIIIHNEAEEYRKERGEIVSTLGKQGVKFAGTGDAISVINATETLNKKLDELNAHRKDKDKTLYNQLKVEYDELDKSLKRFFEIQNTELPKTRSEWLGLQKTINDTKVNVLNNQFEQVNKSIQPFETSLSQLDIKFKTLADNDFTGQMDIFNQKMDVTSKIIEQDSLNLEWLNKTTDDATKSTEEYKQGVQKLKDSIVENTLKNREYAQSIEETKQKQKDYADDLINNYQNYILKTIDSEIKALEKSKNTAKEVAESKIKTIQDEIDALEERNKQLKIEEERQKRLDDLAKLREKVANIEAEKNTQILISTTGKFEYIADPNALREETERLKEMQDDYDDWEKENTRKAEIDRLQNQIETIRDSLEVEEKGYDDRISNLRTFVDEQKLEFNKQKTEITSYQDLIEGLSGLEASSYSARLSELDKFITGWNSKVSGMSGVSAISTGSSTSSSKSKNTPANQLPKDNTGIQPIIVGGKQKWVDTKTGTVYNSIPKYADGTDYHEGGLAIVGDGGAGAKPELINAPKGTQVIPYEQTKKLIDIIPNIPNLMQDFMNKINVRMPEIASKFNVNQQKAGDTIYQFNIDKVVTPNPKSFIQEMHNRTALSI